MIMWCVNRPEYTNVMQRVLCNLVKILHFSVAIELSCKEHSEQKNETWVKIWNGILSNLYHYNNIIYYAIE